MTKIRSVGTASRVLLASALLAPSALATEHGHHSVCSADAPPDPVLHVADLDADGDVDGIDVSVLARAIDAFEEDGYYYGLYDLDANGVIDEADKAIVVDQLGVAVPALETLVASAALATEPYVDLNNAIADGFMPVTNAKEGHGVHWGLFSRIDAPFIADQPYGLNYSDDGELLAIFYRVDFDTYGATLPEGFPGHEDTWHVHEHTCAYNQGGRNASGELDPNLTFFADYVDQRFAEFPFASFSPTGEPWFYVNEYYNSCTVLRDYYLEGSPYLPPVENPEETFYTFRNGFHMLHLWTNDPNPCGRFAGTHPDAAGEPIPPIPGQEGH